MLTQQFFIARAQILLKTDELGSGGQQGEKTLRANQVLKTVWPKDRL
jgi:hypothetical protein